MAAEIHRQIPNWLDRLRSSRGFPAADSHLDLDHFLSSNPNNPNSIQPNTTHPPSPATDARVPDAGYAVIDVLSELFCMGESGGEGRTKKKGCRKQANPKFCVVDSRENGVDRMANENEKENQIGLDSSGGDNNENLGVIHENVEGDERGIDGGEGFDDGEEEELKGYARMEVTVIDTSVGEWKFERFVFRRRNVWKIREKNRKGTRGGTRKRRAGGLSCREKGKAMMVESLGGELEKEGNNGGTCGAMDLDEEQAKEGENEPCNGIKISAGKIPAKRLGSSRTPHKVKSSSVIF
ncbi:hypothetical protein Droror1_Dr00013043 [Drosera rotundifolia]